MARLKGYLGPAVLGAAALAVIGLGAASFQIFGDDGRTPAVSAPALDGDRDAALAAQGECREAPADQAAARSCRPCKDKPYCKCTYNGIPRASCDPCCYFSYPTGYICLD